MDILDLLKNNEKLFEITDFEDKKVKALIEVISNNFVEMNEKINAFNNFSNSQLSGPYYDKLVLVKSLKEYYDDWSGIVAVYNSLVAENKSFLDNYNSTKAKLISNLTALQNMSKTLPVVSLYDLFNNELVRCEDGHEIIILGDKNQRVFEFIIAELNEKLQVESKFNESKPYGLTTNYYNLEKNIENCENTAQQLYATKKGKLDKVRMLLDSMKKVGRKIVEFITHYDELVSVGCDQKQLALLRNSYTKSYEPIKKSLEKMLRFQLINIFDKPTVEQEIKPLAESSEQNSQENVMENYQQESNVNVVKLEDSEPQANVNVVKLEDNEPQANVNVVKLEDEYNNYENFDVDNEEELIPERLSSPINGPHDDQEMPKMVSRHTENYNLEEEKEVTEPKKKVTPNFSSLLSSLQNKVKNAKNNDNDEE